MLLLVGVLAASAQVADAVRSHEPAFSDYPVRVFRGPLRFPREEEWPGPGRLEDSAYPINFGGHFTLIGIPCGTACGAFWFVDRRTGRMFRAPDGAKRLDYESVD